MRTFIRWVLWALVVLTGVVVLVDTMLVVVFRTGWQPGIDAVRRFNRALLNPAMLRRAGTTGWYASSIRHVGRRTGHAYVTPVLAEHVGDRFLIPLPYGADVDWCRNVVAAGEADLDSDGVHYHLVDPAIVGADEAEPWLPDRVRSRLSFYGVARYLRLDAA